MSEKYSTEELVEEITVAFEARIESIDDGYTKSGDERLTKMAPTVKELTQRIKSIIIARLRAGENLENKSLMKLASDLGVSFSAAKILEDHVRIEYDARLRAADKLCAAANGMLGLPADKHKTLPNDHPLTFNLCQAIADYEGKP